MQNNIKTSIIPFLTVANAARSIEFYKTAFNAKEMARYSLPDNKLNATLEIDGSKFYVADEEPQFNKLAPNSDSISPMRIILTTADADLLFEKAINAGAHEVCPMTTEDSWRIGVLQDPSGHTWEIGYPL